MAMANLTIRAARKLIAQAADPDVIGEIMLYGSDAEGYGYILNWEDVTGEIKTVGDGTLRVPTLRQVVQMGILLLGGYGVHQKVAIYEPGGKRMCIIHAGTFDAFNVAGGFKLDWRDAPQIVVGIDASVQHPKPIVVGATAIRDGLKVKAPIGGYWDITFVGLEKQTRQQIYPANIQMINATTDVLYRGCCTPLEIEQAFEEYWNRTGGCGGAVVKVIGLMRRVDEKQDSGLMCDDMCIVDSSLLGTASTGTHKVVAKALMWTPGRWPSRFQSTSGEWYFAHGVHRAGSPAEITQVDYWRLDGAKIVQVMNCTE